MDTTSQPYQVPGDVHTPLIEAGLIPEPLQGMNSLDCRWVEAQEFWREHWQKAPGKLEIWCMNNTRDSREAHLSWTLMTLQGDVLLQGQQAVRMPGNQLVKLTDVELSGMDFDPANAIFCARLLVDGQLVNETKYFFAPFAEMVTRDANVQCICHPLEAGRCEVTLMAERFVWMLHLVEPEGTIYSDNDVELWAGEPKVITVAADEPNETPVLHWMGKEV